MGHFAFGQLNLSAHFLFNFFNFPFRVSQSRPGRHIIPLPNRGIEITIRIRQTGHPRQRAPFVILPFAGQNQMNANVQSWIFVEQLNSFRKPRTGHHELHCRHDTFLIRLNTCHIGGMRGTNIISTDNQIDTFVLFCTLSV